MRSVFVTGTDTEIGKTVIACGLVRAAVEANYAAVGLKPVAAGCELEDNGFVNEDATRLMAVSSVSLPYPTVNPIALEPAIAPHIAAQQVGVSISAAQLQTHYTRTLPKGLDLVIYEGAGGWFVPLNDHETFQDFAERMQLDIVLVVGMKLGCINHALLSVAAIQQTNLRLIGWVANFHAPDMNVAKENLETLLAKLPCELLGVVPHMHAPDPEQVARHLNIEALMS